MEELRDPYLERKQYKRNRDIVVSCLVCSKANRSLPIRTWAFCLNVLLRMCTLVDWPELELVLQFSFLVLLR